MKDKNKDGWERETGEMERLEKKREEENITEL